jgi:hypothetical protein
MKIVYARAWRKLREWIIRYAWSEIVGTVTALSSFWYIYYVSDSLVAAAIAGTVGENIGYYGVIASKELLHYWQEHAGHVRLRRLRLTATRSVRNMLLEFGPAELCDSFFIRPGLFYLLPLWFSGRRGIALIAAKLLADLCFYTMAIIGYEMRKKLFPKRSTPKKEIRYAAKTEQ